jgi:glycosyltransferase involved in cell wall biosynthesis
LFDEGATQGQVFSMKLSVILACYNGALTLAVQLEALKKQEWDHPWEVILADNGSTDDSVALAKRYAEGWRGLRIVDVSARRGKPYALNAAIRTSTSEFIAFCDQDDEVAPGWVAAIGNALEEHDFVGGRLEEKKLNPPWLRWPHQVDGFFKLWYPPFLLYASGCCLGMKRSLFDAVGDFDESLLIIDDADYCIRVQQRGIPLVFVAQAVVHYRRRDSLSALFKQARGYGEWNSVLAKKYAPADSGVRRKYYTKFLREWVSLLRDVRLSRRGGGHAWWVWRFGFQVGRLEGILKHRGIPV